MKNKKLGMPRRIIRLKFYDKTAEKLTSTGVSETNPRDPLGPLLLTKDYIANNNKSKINYKYNFLGKLIHFNGKVITRLEFSFYENVLKNI